MNGDDLVLCVISRLYCRPEEEESVSLQNPLRAGLALLDLLAERQEKNTRRSWPEWVQLLPDIDANLMECFDHVIDSLSIIDGLLDIIASIRELASDWSSPQTDDLDGYSVLVLFLRSIIAEFSQLPFDGVLNLYQQLRAFFSLDKQHHQQLEQRKQEPDEAFRFPSLLDNQQLQNVPDNFPLPTEAQVPTTEKNFFRHYIAFLRAFKQRDLESCIHHLHTYYDYALFSHGVSLFSYASLEMAVVYYHFEAYELCSQHLQECISTAQETNNRRALLLSLYWLFKLRETQKGFFAEHSFQLMRSLVAFTSDVASVEQDAVGLSQLGAIHHALGLGASPPDVRVLVNLLQDHPEGRRVAFVALANAYTVWGCSNMTSVVSSETQVLDAVRDWENRALQTPILDGSREAIIARSSILLETLALSASWAQMEHVAAVLPDPHLRQLWAARYAHGTGAYTVWAQTLHRVQRHYASRGDVHMLAHCNVEYVDGAMRASSSSPLSHLLYVLADLESSQHHGHARVRVGAALAVVRILVTAGIVVRDTLLETHCLPWVLTDECPLRLQCDYYSTLAQLRTLQRRYADSVAAFLQALKRYEKLGDVKNVRETHQLVALLYHKLDDHQQRDAHAQMAMVVGGV